jgi:hypothetical protein
MPLMKTVKCPHCQSPFRVVAEIKGPVQQYRGAQEYAWAVAACEKCFKSYEIYGDPKSTATRPYTPPT